MTCKEILRHHDNVADREYETILDQTDELMEQASFDTELVDSLDAYLLSPETTLFTLHSRLHGRYSLSLVERGFKLLSKGNHRGTSPEQVWEFIGRVLPIAGITVDEELIAGKKSCAKPEHCSMAEGYFVDAYRQITQKRYQEQPEISVYHLPDGRPVILQKNHEYPSGLTLEPMLSEGGVIPAGTIVGIPVRAKDRCMVSGWKEHYGQNARYTSASRVIEKPLAVCPARITPWAYDEPLDRSLFAVVSNNFSSEQGYKIDRQRERLVSRYSLEHFRQAASTLMETCGVSVA